MLRPEDDINEMIAETMEWQARRRVVEPPHDPWVESSHPDVRGAMIGIQCLVVESMTFTLYGEFHPLVIQAHRLAGVKGAN
jgi:hypothetical protein